MKEVLNFYDKMVRLELRKKFGLKAFRAELVDIIEGTDKNIHYYKAILADNVERYLKVSYNKKGYWTKISIEVKYPGDLNYRFLDSYETYITDNTVNYYEPIR